MSTTKQNQSATESGGVAPQTKKLSWNWEMAKISDKLREYCRRYSYPLLNAQTSGSFIKFMSEYLIFEVGL